LVFQLAFQRVEDVSVIRKIEEFGKEVAENYWESALIWILHES
jgi:hypothetical protein